MSVCIIAPFRKQDNTFPGNVYYACHPEGEMSHMVIWIEQCCSCSRNMGFK